MIYQIATGSGFPPSWIEEWWAPEELANAEVLASLEGWGQDKRRTTQIIAEFHNAQRAATYAQNRNPKAQPPQVLTESHFLPRRIRAQRAEGREKSNLRKLTHVMNGLCGY